MSTATQKVYATTSDDHGWDLIQKYMHEKVPGNEAWNERDADLMDWALLYGVAIGIARSEDPFEPLESVAYRAQKVAWTALKVHAHGFTSQPDYPTDEDKRACGWDVPEAVTA